MTLAQGRKGAEGDDPVLLCQCGQVVPWGWSITGDRRCDDCAHLDFVLEACRRWGMSPLQAVSQMSVPNPLALLAAAINKLRSNP